MVEDITTMQAKFTIERGQNPWLAMESLCCDSGIIRFAKSSTACCEQLVRTRGATEKQSLTFILSLWQRERRDPRSVRRVSLREHDRPRTFQDEHHELLRRHGVDFDERYLWDSESVITSIAF